MLRARSSTATATLAVATLLGLAACGTSSSASPASPSPSPTAKTWVVDTSGWWVPDDPTGCLQETVTCKTSVWKTRAYEKGNFEYNLIQHGEEVTLLCKAPTPVPLRNSVKTEAVNAYYIQWQGKNYWIPDVYMVKDDAAVAAMAADVPDCTSDTPGVNG